MITYDDLAMMKPTAFFINTSRGPLVDENALIKILKEERIAGAGLDVFDVEPLPLDHPIRSLKRVTLSPHTGYLTDSNYSVSDIHLIISFYMSHESRMKGVLRADGREYCQFFGW